MIDQLVVCFCSEVNRYRSWFSVEKLSVALSWALRPFFSCTLGVRFAPHGGFTAPFGAESVSQSNFDQPVRQSPRMLIV